MPSRMRVTFAVQVHAIFEPRQDSTAHEIVLAGDDDLEGRLGKLAAMMGRTACTKELKAAPL